MVLSLLPVGIVQAESAPSAPGFSDLPGDHPDRDHILFLAAKGLINGYPDGRFGPADALNRAAAAKIAIQVANLAPRSAGAALGFSDLPDTHWSTPYVRAGVEGKLIQGFDDKTFRPNEGVSRAQLAALAIRATRQPTDRIPTLNLKDVQPSDWFYREVTLAVAAGILQAPDGAARPNETATRAEAARAFGQALMFTPRAFATPLSVTVQADRGQVEIQQPGETTWTRIEKPSTLAEGGRIRTSGASAAQISFPDGSLVVLEADSELVVTKSRGAEMVTTTGVEELELDLIRGELLTALAPRLAPEEAAALSPTIARFMDKQRDAVAAEKMAPRVRAASSHTGQNLPDGATGLMVFVDPASLEPGDQETADVTIVLVNAAGEPVVADKGDVTLEILSDVGNLSNPNPVIPQGFQAVTVQITPPAEEPEDAKTRITAIAGELSTSTVVPTSKVNWWSSLFSKKTRAKVRMPWSVASVRGTVAKLTAGAKVNKVIILNGTATLTSAVTGTSQEVPPLQSTGTSSPDEPIPPSGPLTAEDQKNVKRSERVILNALDLQKQNATGDLQTVTKAEAELAQKALETIPPDEVNPTVSISSPSDGFTAGVATVRVSGSAGDNIGVASVTVNGVAASVSGNSWTADVPLQLGNNPITATATDDAGNSASASVTVILDAAAPSVSLNVPGTTKEAILNISGSLKTPGGLRSLTLNGSSIPIIGDAIVGATFSAQGQLEPGLNLIEAEVTDNQGRSAIDTKEVVLATAPPQVSLSGDDTAAKVQYVLKGRAVPLGTKLKSVTVNGQGVNFSTDPEDYGSFAATLDLKPGDNAIEAVATDDAGNSGSASKTVKLDAEAPTIQIVNPRSESFLGRTDGSVSVRVTFKAPLGIRSLSIGGQSVQVPENASTAEATVTLNNGENVIDAVLVGTEGREARDSIKVYRVSQNPTVSISTPKGGTRASKNTVEVIASAAAAFGPLQSVNVNGVPMVLGGSGYIGSVSLQSGENQITVTATDKAKNQSSASVTVLYNPNAALVSITAPTDKLVTRQATVTVTGSVANGEGITSVSVNGTAATLTNGSFTAQVALTPGSNKIAASVPQEFGGAADSRTVVYADRAPNLSVSSPNNNLITGDRTVSVSGSAVTSYNTPALVTVNGTSVVNSAGGFQTQVTLKRGANTITVVATDDAGNTATESRSVEFKPALPVISITSPNDKFITKDAKVAVAGSVTTKYGVKFVQINSGAATVSGNSFSGEVQLQPGVNTITVTAGDNEGGTSSTTITVTRTGIKPTISINSPNSGTEVGQAALTVKITASSQISKNLRVTVNGNGTTPVSGGYEGTVTLVPGTNTITATVTDEFGDSASASATVTYKVGAPTLAISGPQSGVTVRESSITVAGSVESLDPNVTVSVNGQTVRQGPGSFSASVALVAGPNQISVTATNPQGGTAGTVSQTISVTRIASAPRVTISSPASGATPAEPSVTVSGSVDTLAKLTDVKVDGRSVGTAKSFSFTLPLADLNPKTITVSATDEFGQTGSASVTVTWTPPPVSVTISAPGSSAAATVNVTGSVSGAVSPATVSVNGVTAAVSGTGYSATVPLTAKGANNVTATVTDGRGRTASASTTVNFNPTPPALSVSQPSPASTVTVSGSASSQYGDLVVSVSGQTFNLGTGGTFSASITLTPNTPTTINVTATDKFGSTSQSFSLTYVPPSTTPPAPSLTVTAPAQGSEGGNALTVTGTFTAGSGVTSVTVNGVAATGFSTGATSGSFSGQVLLTQSGPDIPISVVLTDAIARTASVTRSVTVTGTIPVILHPITGGLVQYLEFTVIASPTATLELLTDGVVISPEWMYEYEPGTFTGSIQLPDGTHSFQVRQQNGNLYLYSVPVTVTVDSVGPEVTVNGLADPVPLTAGTVINLTGTVSDLNLDTSRVYVVATSTQSLVDTIATISDPVASLEFVSEADRAVVNGTNWTKQLTLDSEANLAGILAVDHAGNISFTALHFARVRTTKPTVRMVTRTMPAVPGEKVYVDVYLDNLIGVQNLSSATVELIFPPTELLSPTVTHDGLLLGAPAQVVVKDDLGTVQFNISSSSEVSIPSSGSAKLFTLEFTVAPEAYGPIFWLEFGEVSGLTGGDGIVLLATDPSTGAVTEIEAARTQSRLLMFTPASSSDSFFLK